MGEKVVDRCGLAEPIPAKDFDGAGCGCEVVGPPSSSLQSLLDFLQAGRLSRPRTSSDGIDPIGRLQGFQDGCPLLVRPEIKINSFGATQRAARVLGLVNELDRPALQLQSTVRRPLGG